MSANWQFRLPILLAALLFCVSPSLACQCGPIGGDPIVSGAQSKCPDPANAKESGTAFIGTPISVGPVQGPPTSELAPGYIYHFQVDENFRGADSKEVDVYTGSGGGDCGTRFDLGVKYLVKAYDSRGILVTGICNRDEPASSAEAEIRTLRAQTNGKHLTPVYGYLHLDRMPPYGISPLDGKPVPDVIIHMISSDGRSLNTQTNKSGIFQFDDVPAGTYYFTADLPPNLALDSYSSGVEHPYKFPDNACFDVDLRANPAVPKAAAQSP